MIILCKPNRVQRTYLGGHRIDKLHNSANPVDNYYPEEWIASVTSANNLNANNEGVSLSYGDVLLSSILKSNPEFLGKHDSFPILFKLLDAAERLVIQAHPTVKFARQHFNSRFGKTECWHILEADPDAHVFLGFKEGDHLRERWHSLFLNQDIAGMLDMLHKIPVQAGDVWFVDGGVPHAIGGGCLMAELQEPTDLMVIPEKITPSGHVLPEHKLHGGIGFDLMFGCFDYTGYSKDSLYQKFYRKPIMKPNDRTIIIGKDLTDKFQLSAYDVKHFVQIKRSPDPAAAIVIRGSGKIEDADGITDLNTGDSFFIPATTREMKITGELLLLIAEP